MLKRYSIAQARNNLPALVRDVERTAAVELTRRGKPVAVLLSRAEYQRLLSDKGSFWDAFQDFKERVDLVELSIGPEVFQGLRDEGIGREIDL